jgi:DNA-binding CsgD family transcriptional regulator
LNLLARPVLVVDREARLFFANAAGEQLLRNRDVLRVVAGRVRAAHRDDDDLLARALRPVPRAADGDGRLTLRRAGADRPAVIQVTPLRHRNRAEWTGRIALLVEAPPPLRRFEALAAAFRLSPAEARLWAALAAGRRLAEFAAESEISVHTARVQLRALFAKTGVHRQTDLLQLAIEQRTLSP